MPSALCGGAQAPRDRPGLKRCLQCHIGAPTVGCIINVHMGSDEANPSLSWSLLRRGTKKAFNARCIKVDELKSVLEKKEQKKSYRVTDT